MNIARTSFIFILPFITIACTTSSNGHVFKSECGFFELSGSKPLTYSIENENVVSLDGVICSGSLDTFVRLTGSYPNLHTLNINIIEGSSDDETNLKLSKLIHDMGINTHLNKDGLIASGGVDLFLAGIHRTAEDAHPQIGVHSWESSDGTDGGQMPKSDPVHQKYLTYYNHINVEPDFYWFTLEAAPASNIHWMTQSELAQYRVITP
ncbi:hypothetical protein [Vibrio sp. VPAP30]|uniref:hypothetical protein n=1 Tax=Vibrio sp. VPAP30 TaxID=1647102 RepID=UPI00065835A6|nr:hypothetical protein [Vibrio sp. VPAP30]KLN64833.1 hypothetical protein ZX61_13335 [Vibrio sp. VPAP30]